MPGSEGTGDRFQRNTRYYRDRESEEPSYTRSKPALYKRYEGVKIVRLDPAASTGGLPLWEAIRARRSVRGYSGQPIEKSELSQILWAAQGITRGSGEEAYRATPSAGALYPVETYVVIHAVDGIEPGVYHYGVARHQLEQLRTGDFRGELEGAAVGQQMVRQAAVVFIWSAIFDRCKWKYGQRAYRYVYLDAGHVAQNLALAAVAQGLASCPIAAFYDNELNTIIDVDGETESVIYLTAVGRKKQARRPP